MFGRPLRKAIDRGLKPGGDLVEELRKVQLDELSHADDAEAICDALSKLPLPTSDEYRVSSPLHALTAYFQNVAGADCPAYDIMYTRGLDELIRLFDLGLQSPEDDAGDLLFILKMFAMYGAKKSADRIVRAARLPLAPDNYMWHVVFEAVDADSPLFEFLAHELCDPLPQDFIAISFLDCMNRGAIAGKLANHPYDSPAGRAQISKWLSDNNPEHFSYAHSATATLPFISLPVRNDLLALAMDHVDPHVQLEAGWAAAKLGSEGGVKLLARYCCDPNHSEVAQRYLEELGRADAIPAEALDPDFQATAAMASWLAHPQEFGRAPDELTLVDSRELFWPPTDDKRWLWVFRYLYRSDSPDEPDNVGHGMFGSVTFALFGETNADLSPEDVIALHCCWELEMNKDRRAPKKRAVEAGRQILAKYNS